MFDARAQRLLHVMQALPTKLRVFEGEGRVVLSTGTMPFAALVAGEHDAPGDVVRDFVREYALTLRAFAADCAYRFQQRQAWTRWADTLQEVLRREYD
jgi:hypothetical protein